MTTYIVTDCQGNDTEWSNKREATRYARHMVADAGWSEAYVYDQAQERRPGSAAVKYRRDPESGRVYRAVP